MGVLSATGAASVAAEPSSGGDVGAELEGGAEDTADAGGQADAGADTAADGGQPPKPESRRQRAARELAETVSRSLEEKFAKEREADRGRYSQLEQRAAWLQGQLETLQRQPAQTQQTQQGPDPDALVAEAKKLLDAGDFNGYERLKDQAYEIRAERKAEAKIKAAMEQMQQRMPQAPDPFINAMLSRHQNVALAGPRGEQAYAIKLNELRIMTHHPDHLPPTQEMKAKAFELADQFLAGLNKQTARPTFGQDASSVTAPAASRNGGNGAVGGGAESQLNDAEKAAMRAGGFKNEAEYNKWRDPSAWVKKW